MEDNKFESVQRFLDGDLDAFEDVFNENYKFVYYSCYRYARSHDLAEDLTQEVFWVVYKNLKDLNNPFGFHAWVRKIVHSVCLREIEKKSNQMYVDLGENFDIESIEGLSTQPDEGFLNEELNREILSSIKDLPTALQTVAEMRFYQGFSISEISSITEVSEGTIKSRIHSIRGKLQEDLVRKNITPQSYFSVSFPVLIYHIYSLWNQEISGKMVHTSKDSYKAFNVQYVLPLIGGAPKSKGGTEILSTLAVIFLSAGIGAVTLNSLNSSAATLTDLDFSSERLCGSIPITISTSDMSAVKRIELITEDSENILPVQNADNYVVNVSKNGTYKVVLEDMEGNVSTEQFTINSITCDVKRPTEISLDSENQQIVVGYGSIEFINENETYILTSEGKLSPNIDKENNRLVFSIDNYEVEMLHIEDDVGNSYEIDLRIEH